MTTPHRPLALTLFFALYLVGAAAFVVLAFRPDLASDPGAGDEGLLRVVFACVAAVNASIGVAGFRRARRVRGAASWLHALVALFAASGLAGALAGQPFVGDDLPSLGTKALVHVAVALVWRSAALRRYFG